MHMNKVKSQEHTVQWGERGHLQRILRMYHLHQLFKVCQKTKTVWLFMDTRATCDGMLVAPGIGWRGRVPRRKTAVEECLKAS